MLEIRRLRLLLELDRRGTIAAVAAALHFSPSGVSQQLALLETEVGVPLLERVGRRVRLTEAARVLSQHADEVIRGLEQAEAEVSAFVGQAKGTVRVAAFQTAALALVPTALDALAGERELRVELSQVEPEQALSGLLARDFDLMIGEEYPGVLLPMSPQVDRFDLGEDPLELAIPDHVRVSSVPAAVRDASECAWVMEPASSASRVWATAVCRAAGFEPDVQFESNDMLLHRELVRRGHAAAFIPAMLFRALGSPLAPGRADHVRTIFTAVRRGRGRHPAILAVRTALAAAADSIVK